ATQDRLVQTQKLASLGQLTAGIAHEIKNPLNFVNNFSGLSAEMIDELREALADLNVTEKKRGEITELMQTLLGNLDRAVQHGKRADAIIKNMLLHSREGSGEHRVVDINALVEESLISPGMGRGPRSRASPSRSNAHWIRRPARPTSSRRTSRGRF